MTYRTTDGPDGPPRRRQTYLDADARRVMALPTSTLSDGGKLVWLHIWAWCGSQPTRRTVTIRDLTDMTGSDRRTVWDRLRQIERAGLISVEDRDRRAGQVTVHVYRVPDTSGQPVQPDPQQRLPLTLSPTRTTDLCIHDPARRSVSRRSVHTQTCAPTDDDTSYPRTHSGAPAVVDDDDDDVVSSTASIITDEEIRDATSALTETLATWRLAGIRTPPSRANRSMWAKVHTLLLRSMITPEQYHEGIAAVQRAHDSGGIRRTPWAVLWGAWQAGIPDYTRLLRSLDLPAGWHEIMTGDRPRDSPAAETCQGPMPESRIGDDGAWWQQTLDDPRIAHLRVARLADRSDDPPPEPADAG